MGKGSAFEREVCKEFSLWFSEGKGDDLFWRTQGSGARATQRSKRGKDTPGQHGDMTAVDERGKPFTDRCSVEMKTGYTSSCGSCMNPLDVLDRSDRKKKLPLFLEFWAQAERGASEEWKSGQGNKDPLLVFRRTQRQKLIAMPGYLATKLKGWFGYSRKDHLALTHGARNETTIVIMRLKDFFEWVEPSYFRRETDG